MSLFPLFHVDQDLDKIVEREEEEGSCKKVIRKITYKGEVEIETEKTEAIEVCSNLMPPIRWNIFQTSSKLSLLLCFMNLFLATMCKCAIIYSSISLKFYMQTIAPPEEVALTPSTPLTPTATPKLSVQSTDGTKASDNGASATTGKQDGPKSKSVTTQKPAEQKTKPNKDRLKSANVSKSEPSTKPESKPSVGKETEVGEEKQGGSVLDLLTDTTADHEKHIYHPQCQICLGKKSPPTPQTDPSRDEEYVFIL